MYILYIAADNGYGALYHLFYDILKCNFWNKPLVGESFLGNEYPAQHLTNFCASTKC